MKRPLDRISDEVIARALSAASTNHSISTSKRRRTTWVDGAAAAAGAFMSVAAAATAACSSSSPVATTAATAAAAAAVATVAAVMNGQATPQAPALALPPSPPWPSVLPLKKQQKKPLSQYVLWMREERGAYKTANADTSGGELATIMGAVWQTIPSEAKNRISGQQARYNIVQGNCDAPTVCGSAATPPSIEARAPTAVAAECETQISLENEISSDAHVLGAVGCRASKLSKTDAKMVSKRRLRDRVEDVPYDFELVPKTRGCSLRGPAVPSDGSMLSRSVLLRVDNREVWASGLTEILQICSEAAWRRSKASLDVETQLRAGRVVAASHDSKPLMLEYIADRLDTDDPIWGYQVRTEAEGWLQGFIVVTDFTTWASYFRFDSHAPSNGITADDVKNRVTDYCVQDMHCADAAGATHEKVRGSTSSVHTSIMRSRAVCRENSPSQMEFASTNESDVETCNISSIAVAPPIPPTSGPATGSIPSGFWDSTYCGKSSSKRIAISSPTQSNAIGTSCGRSLASSMETEPRWGEPEGEGVVFHTIAEISLLGALGCGAWLLQLVLQELKSMGRYKYVILQATDQAIPFYESMGFARIGCVARHARGKKDGRVEHSQQTSEAKQKANAHEGAATARQHGIVNVQKKVIASSNTLAVGDSDGRVSVERNSATHHSSPFQRREGKRGSGSPLMPTDRGEELRFEDAFYWLTIYMSHFLQQLRNLDSECIFHHPVSIIDVPNYLNIIPSHRPMDLSTMQRKVIAHRYENLATFLEDVKLIVANALSYNRGVSLIYRRAKKLISEAITLVQVFRVQVSATCILSNPRPGASPVTVLCGATIPRTPRNQNPILANASRTMVPPVWSANDTMRLAPKYFKSSGETATAMDYIFTSTKGGTTFGRGGAAPPPLQKKVPADYIALQDLNLSKDSVTKDLPVKTWVKLVAAAAAAASEEDKKVDRVGGGLGSYRNMSEKRHYDWLSTAEGHAFSARLAAAADHDTSVLGYVHWTFPDQVVEDQYPSYIMARSLDDVVANSSVTDKMTAPTSIASSSSSTTPGINVDPSLPRFGGAAKIRFEEELSSPELAAGYPRGVTPRGPSFVAKFGFPDGYDYLGSFPSSVEASAAYDERATAQENRRNFGAKGSSTQQNQSKASRAKVSSKEDKIPGGNQSPGRCTIECSISSSQVPAAPASAKEDPMRLYKTRPLPPPVIPIYYARAQWLVHESVPVRPLRMVELINDTTGKYALGGPSDSQEQRGARFETFKKNEKVTSLYNRIVTVEDQPPCYSYKYWFVYQYVPDMEWCHLCPLRVEGAFKQGPRKGRKRFKLVPEGQAREIDAPAARCRPVEAKQCVGTSLADQEVFDILSEPPL